MRKSCSFFCLFFSEETQDSRKCTGVFMTAAFNPGEVMRPVSTLPAEQLVVQKQQSTL